MSKGCEIREIELGGKNSFGFECLRRGKRVGAISVAKKKVAGRVRFVVRGINVLEKYRRTGVATQLYEVAAREACRRRAPLASDERYGTSSRAFWMKQLAKGRAKVLAPKAGREDRASKGDYRRSEVFTLQCPAPASLSGLRKKRRHKW